MMNDLMLTQEGVSEDNLELDDFYSTQAGDAISSKTQVKDRRRTYLGLTLLFCGFILVGVGVTVASATSRENNDNSQEKQIASPGKDLADRQPLDPRGPALSPTMTPTKAPDAAPATATPTRSTPTGRTAPPVQTTLAPTVAAPATTAAPTAKMTLAAYLDEWLGPDALSDETSTAFQAYTWLSGNAKLDQFDSVALRQRFTAAALHLATNKDNSWKATDGWMTHNNECDWHGIECNDEGFLIVFNLTSNGLSGLIPSEITLLSETLLSLDLSYNDVDNADEELFWLAELTNLRAMNVKSTNFQAHGIPSYLGKLTDMRILDISYTGFLGPIDGTILKPMKELLYLEMGGNSYNSSFPASIASLPKLEALYLEDCDLEGDLSFIFDLESVMEVWIDDNPNLGGSIPTAIGEHTTLKSLSFSNCGLTGEIPSEIGHLMDMEQMWFYGNYLEGEIPREIGGLEKLKIFQVEDNNLTGDMPDEICALRDDTLGLLALGSDCDTGEDVTCDCCTCCEAPCEIIATRRSLMKAYRY